jgi:hypothetical protein
MLSFLNESALSGISGRKGTGNRLKDCNLSKDFNENLKKKFGVWRLGFGVVSHSADLDRLPVKTLVV